MHRRLLWSALLVVGAAIPLTSCSNPSGLDSIQVSPATQSLNVGQTVQLTVTGTYGNSKHASTQQITTGVTWTSSTPAVATVDTAGLVTAVGGGSATITASAVGFAGAVTSNAAVTVASTGSTTAGPEPILSLEIIPSAITVNDFNLTGQFIAIATYATPPYVRDVTNDPSTIWLSSEPNFFPVSTNTGGGPGASAGIVTAEGAGGATIIAESASPDGTIQTATATFSCPQVLQAAGSNIPPSCPDTIGTGSPLLSTLTVYERGLNTTSWEVTAPSATGTPNVLHCGPGWTGAGGSICTATYPAGSTVTLTSPAGAGAFGGWSTNCAPTTAVTADGPNSCRVTLTDDDVVGVIVN
jgi:Bacterial Ig-like domain (group 2)